MKYFNMTDISNSKFRYLIVINFLSAEYLLLTEQFDGTMKKSHQAVYIKAPINMLIDMH